jgi:hypothetical protein
LRYVTAAPEGPQKLAIILAEEIKQVQAIDRYEQRARSRRDVAIRALDEARSRLSNKSH